MLKQILSFCIFFMLLLGSSLSSANDDLLLQFTSPEITSTQVKEYLPVSQAFTTSTDIDEASQSANVTITPARGYYLYKSKITVTHRNGSIIKVDLPSGIEHTDDFMGTQIVYYIPVHVKFPLLDDTVVTYQGCTQGMCYPPQQIEVKIPKNLQKAINLNSQPLIKPEGLTELSNQSKATNNWLTAVKEAFVFLIIGISLSFTPCVFPMYPILSMILFGRNREQQENRKTFTLSWCFVLGIALTYTVIGVVSSYFGAQTHAFLQQSYILIIFSLIFVILSLSMLGLFTIQIPAGIASKLQKIADEQHSGSKSGAFIVGIITSLVCSPCTTAPVSASILYTIQAGNIYLGTLDLFLLGFGMGVPMLAIGLFGKKVLPKTGNWLNLIKQLIGIFSLMVPFILLDRILPHWILPCGIIILSGCAIMLLIHYIKPRLTLPVLPLVIAMGMGFGWYFVDWTGTHRPILQFNNVTSLEQIQDLINENPNRKVLIDFYASWCTSCKQYEEETFASGAVQTALKDYLLIRVDMSETSGDNQKISQYFNLIGLPSVVITDTEHQPTLLSGFYDSKSFVKKLKEQH